MNSFSVYRARTVRVREGRFIYESLSLVAVLLSDTSVCVGTFWKGCPLYWWWILSFAALSLSIGNCSFVQVERVLNPEEWTRTAAGIMVSVVD